ncbi:MAG: hypothetical protein Q9213_005219 [Squamulea squamosa]
MDCITRHTTDFASEIRLQIYPYLLHGYRSYRHENENFSLISYDRTELSIASAEDDAHPLSVYHDRYCTTTNQYWYGDERVFPQILRTCRRIWDEATPMLYRDNTFSFWSDGLELDNYDHVSKAVKLTCKQLMTYEIGDEEKDDDEDDEDTDEGEDNDTTGDQELMVGDIDIEQNVAKEVFDKDKTTNKRKNLQGATWTTRVPLPINKSTLAAFLRKIGGRNCSSIRNLELRSWDAWQAAEDVILATELCGFHMPGLQILKLHVVEKDIHEEESPDYWHPDWSSPFWCNGPFKPMYRALQQFVRKVYWLEVLEYDKKGQFRFQDDAAMRKIRELEESVKARAMAKEGKVARQGERDKSDLPVDHLKP